MSIGIVLSVDRVCPYDGAAQSGRLRFFAKTLRRETPQGDTAVSAQNDGRTQESPYVRFVVLSSFLNEFVIFRGNFCGDGRSG